MAIADTDRQFRAMRERIEILQAEGRAVVDAMQATRARRTAAYRQGFLHGLAEAGYIGRSIDAPTPPSPEATAGASAS